MPRAERRLFPALLRHHRTRRGLTQLDLALNAEVSTRHVSFLETGRAQPSREMVLRLGDTLGLGLREQNELLRAAGHREAFVEGHEGTTLPPTITLAIERMEAQQEPYPLTVLDASYNVLRANQAAFRMLSLFVDPAHLVPPLNVLRLCFDPSLLRPWLIEFDRIAHAVLARLHRELLERPDDAALSALLDELLRMPGSHQRLRSVDLSSPSEPILPIRLRKGDLSLSFLTTVTVFNAPQQVDLDEIKIESYFPLDDATALACARLAREGAP